MSDRMVPGPHKNLPLDDADARANAGVSAEMIKPARAEVSAGQSADSSDHPAGVAEAAPVPLPATLSATADSTSSADNADEIAEWNKQVKRRMRAQTRRSFLVGGVAAAAGLGGWQWLRTRREELDVEWPLRLGLEMNEQWARDYFRPRRATADLSGKARLANRVNGDLGLDHPVDLASWRLSVDGLANHDDPLELALDAIKKLPRTEMTADFKCIEGWNMVVQWAGVRFSHFIAAYPPATQSGDPLDLENDPGDLPRFVGMATPDGGYYVGLDIESMLHPQTLLAYEMNGAALSQEHGAPLRLVTPVKYGIKSIKRIGTIRFGAARPADYWAEQGYDWYAGL